MMSQGKAETEFVDASPTRRFFVEMLTRDIALDDAVLDLLDNSIDGVLRQTRGASGDKPLSGYWAKITLSTGKFVIEDNCGGIPREATDYAFRMGRPTDDPDKDIPTAGVYGIGMKRAIFKMGRAATIHSKTADEDFKVTIDKNWVHQAGDWQFPIEYSKHAKAEVGTKLVVTDLIKDVERHFVGGSFGKDLRDKISSYYSVIIRKGFVVYVNSIAVKPRLLRILFAEDGIRPYVYRDEVDGVSVKLAVGLYKPLPSLEDAEREQVASHSSDDAGWTIICNDRVVIACDKTRLTGWGEASVPSYHPQFIAISGVVDFSSNDAKKLPVTTTKRNIDASSDLYSRVKDQMRAGTKLFTNYTNKWKAHLPEQRKLESKTKSIDIESAFTSVPRLKKQKRTTGTAYVFVPELPTPVRDRSDKAIRFFKEEREISKLAEFLFDDADAAPSDVGSECFDRVLKTVPKK